MARRKIRLPPVSAMVRNDGALAVTFANVGYGGRPELESFDAVLAWCVGAEALSADQAAAMQRIAAADPKAAKALAQRALALHQRLRRLFIALSEGLSPAAEDFDALNVDIGVALANRCLVAVSGGYRWAWGDSGDNLERLLWPILMSASSVMVQVRRYRVGTCDTEGCNLLFVAKNPGRRRRWCGPKCRNRAKATTFYHRTVKPARLKHAKRAKQVRREMEARIFKPRSDSELAE